MAQSTESEPPAARRYDYGWNIVALSVLASLFSIGVVFYTHGVFRLYLIRDFGFTEGDTFNVYSYYIGAVAFYSFSFTPWLIERIGSKRTMMLGSVILSTGLFALSHAPNKSVFFVIFALVLSLGVNCMGKIPPQTALTYWFDHKRGQALSIAATGVTAGGIVNIPLATWLIETYGWRVAYRVFAAIVLCVGMFLIGPFFYDRPEQIGLSTQPDPGRRPPPASSDQGAKVLSYRALLSNSVFLRLALSLGLASTGWAVILQSLVADLREQGYGTTLSTLYMTALTWVILAGKPLFGTVTDRVERKHAILLASALQLIAIVFFLLSRFAHPLSFALGGGRGDVALVLAILLYGIGIAGTQPLYTTYQAELLGRENFARAAGVSVPIVTLVQLVGYKLNAVLLDSGGSHVWMWILMGVFYGAALLLLASLPRAVRDQPSVSWMAADTAPEAIASSLVEPAGRAESGRR